ncbi:MAG: hypothetical protein ACP5I4_09530 [Oceanipulchritudo sp.]
MQKHVCVNERARWYEYDGAGRRNRVAVDFDNPATELGDLEEEGIAGAGACSEEAVAVLRRLFELCALRSDGKLHTPKGMALRMCCVASLLQIYPIDGVPFPEIARHCGLTRAAVSKTMLELTELTGIRSRQQRSDRARRVYRKRAIAVHARRLDKKKDAPEEAPAIEFSTLTTDEPERANCHE